MGSCRGILPLDPGILSLDPAVRRCRWIVPVGTLLLDPVGYRREMLPLDCTGWNPWNPWILPLNRTGRNPGAALQPFVLVPRRVKSNKLFVKVQSKDNLDRAKMTYGSQIAAVSSASAAAASFVASL